MAKTREEQLAEAYEAAESGVSGGEGGGGDAGNAAEAHPPENVELPEAETPVDDAAGDKLEASAPAAAAEGTSKKVTPKPTKGKTAPDGKSSPPAPAADPGPKAPQAWPVAVREHWAKLPPEVRAVVDKREKEVAKALAETAASRRTAAEFEKTIAPYKPFMRGEPLEEVEGLFKTAVALQAGSAETKAAIVANIIQNLDVPVAKVAALLNGGKPPAEEPGEAPGAEKPAPPPPQEFRDKRFDAFMTQVQKAQQQRVQREKQHHEKELETFASSGKAEFLDDVLKEMVFVEKWAREQGETLSLEEVYERACMLNKEVRPLWEQRKATQEAAANAKTSTQPRTRVSSSVRHEPAPPPSGAKPTSRRAQLEEAYEKSLRR